MQRLPPLQSRARGNSVGGLSAFPNRGRRGRVEGTRELVFAPLPFVSVYEVNDTVQVLRILHRAQQWPPA